MARKKGVKSILIIIGFIIASSILFPMLLESDSAVVNLVLKKKGKVYVFSKMGTFLAQNSLKKNESPSVVSFMQVFEGDGTIYAAPHSIGDFVNLLCGNYVIHEHKENNQDGYITVGKSNCLSNSIKNENGENIGEQIRINTLELENTHSGESFEISWEQNVKTYESRALKNCEDKSFMISTQVYKGKSVMSSKKLIMVDLGEIVKFYGNKANLEFNEDQQLLHIEFD